MRHVFFAALLALLAQGCSFSFISDNVSIIFSDWQGASWEAVRCERYHNDIPRPDFLSSARAPALKGEVCAAPIIPCDRS